MRSIIHSLTLLVAASTVRADQLTYDVQLPTGAPEAEGFGADIAIDDTLALVGAQSATRGGGAYLMQRSAAGWDHFRHLDPPSFMHAGSGFGAAVGLLGDHALVGAPNYNPGSAFNQGLVRYYQRQSDGEWYSPSQLFVQGLGTNSLFGSSIDLTTIGNETFAAVGAPGNLTLGQSGSVYIFRRAGLSWTHVATVSAGAIGDGFGTSVALSGQTLVVGAPYHAVTSSPTNAGRVYFYRNLDATGQSWIFEDAEVDPLAQTAAAFGFDVDVSGSWAVVGSPFWGSSNSGAVLFYERVGSAWIMRTCAGGNAGSQLGWSVSMGLPFSGVPRCVVGRPGTEDAQYWVQQTSGTWSPTHTFTTTNPGSGFGQAVGYVEIDSNLPGALIGAPQSDVFAPDAGHVAAFELQLFGPLVGWFAENTFSGLLHDSDDLLGAAVDGMNGLWAYGAPGDDDESGGSGAVYVYRRVAGDPSLTFEDKLTVPVAVEDGSRRLGDAVSVYDGRIAAGAPNEDTSVTVAGAVYVFGDSTGSWQQEARVVPPVAYQGAFFGNSVILHRDLLLAGAPGDGAVVANSGAVHVFREQGSQWVHETELPNPDQEFGLFGNEIAFDGRTLVVANTIKDNGRGAVYVYTWDGVAWSYDQRLDGPSGLTEQYFGIAIDVQGNRIVGGGSGLSSLQGEAYLFERSPSGWARTHTFAGNLFDFGTGVAVCGEAIAIGETPGPSLSPPADTGSVSVYRDAGSQSVQLECTVPGVTSSTGADSYLGETVALDGREMGVGAPGFAMGYGPRSGHAWSVELPDITGPVVYCHAVRDSVGCLPYIDYVGVPSFTGQPGAMTLTAANTINNKTGLMMYGFGRAELPFMGGTLCIQPPVRRTSVQFTGGTAGLPDCTGQMMLDFTTQMQSSTDPFLAPGATVNCQYRYRDPAASFGIAFTNALEFAILP